MNLDTKLEVSTSVVTREIGGETMLMDLESGTYFGLNALGGRIWQALEDGQSLAELHTQIEDEFDVAPEQLRQDMLALARDLLENKLVAEASD